MPTLAVPQIVDSLGDHVVPGIVLVIISSALLLTWEFMRLGWAASARLRWLVSFSGITLGVVSLLLIALRFLAIE
jgi:hypothetical protein